MIRKPIVLKSRPIKGAVGAMGKKVGPAPRHHIDRCLAQFMHTQPNICGLQSAPIQYIAQCFER